MECHKYLRETFDSSVVSLREITRFNKIFDFFMKYFSLKYKYEKSNQRKPNEINWKLRSIICSIYLYYYIRLTDKVKISGFEIRIKKLLLDLVNHLNNEKETKNKDESNSKPKEGDLIEEIKNEEFKTDIKSSRTDNIKQFSDFLKIEEKYLLNKVKLDEYRKK